MKFILLPFCSFSWGDLLNRSSEESPSQALLLVNLTWDGYDRKTWSTVRFRNHYYILKMKEWMIQIYLHYLFFFADVALYGSDLRLDSGGKVSLQFICSRFQYIKLTGRNDHITAWGEKAKEQVNMLSLVVQIPNNNNNLANLHMFPSKRWIASSASGQDGVTRTEFTQQPKIIRKLDKIYKTTVFRHWTSGSTGEWSQRVETSGVSSMIIPVCFLKRVFGCSTRRRDLFRAQ